MNSIITPNALHDLKQVQARAELESIGMESFSDTIRRIMPTVSGAIASVKSGFDYVMSSKKGTDLLKYNERDFSKFADKMSEQKFVNNLDLRVYIPEGFQGNLVAYARLLDECVDHANKSIADVIDPFNIFLSKLLSDPGAAADTKLQLSNLTRVGREREALKKGLAAFAHPGSTETKAKMGDVIGRSEDWKELNFSLKSIHGKFDMDHAKAMNASISHCAELLNALTEQARENDFEKISAQTLRTLGDAALEVAQEADFYAIVNYKVTVLLTVLSQTREFLEKNVK